MNRYPETIKVPLSPPVQTVSEVHEDPLPVNNDGIKDFDIISMIDKLFTYGNTQVIVNSNASSSAVTIKIRKTEVNKFLSMLDLVGLTGRNVISQIKALIENRLSINPEDDWVSLQRKDVSALAILRAQLEKLVTTTIKSGVLSRMLLLTLANTDFTSRPELSNLSSVIDLLNGSKTKKGTKLLKDALKYTPSEIGCSALSRIVKSADISLESKAVVRQTGQNQAMDMNVDDAILSIDAFSTNEIAVLQLSYNLSLENLVSYYYYKNAYAANFTTDWASLNPDLSLLEQDWYSASKPTPSGTAPNPTLDRILTRTWSAHTEVALNRIDAGTLAGWLIKLGMDYTKPYLESIFPSVPIGDPKKPTMVSMVDCILGIIFYTPTTFWETVAAANNGTLTNTDANGNDMTDTYKLFLKMTFVNYLPNLVRLGKIILSEYTIPTEVIRTELGILNDKYNDYVQGQIQKQGIGVTVILTP